MRFFISILIGLFPAIAAIGQNSYLIKPENADCSKPVEIKDTIFGPTNAPAGYGSLMEIDGDKTSLYNFEKEHNTCWYFFKARYDAQLEIEIIPVNINDDYDFVLYRYNGKTFCSDVAEKKIKPVRTCISRNDKNLGSRTGLSKQAADEYIHSGPGASFSRSIQVKKGEIYYLVVDNVYPNGKGHTIRLHYSDIRETETPVKPKKSIPQKAPVQVIKKAPILITVFDKETQKPVKANIKIVIKSKQEKPALAVADSALMLTDSLSVSGAYTIRTEANNYFDDTRDIKTGATADKILVRIELSRIKVGQNVVFENILFQGNSAEFLPESKPELEVIANTLKKNPSMHIEIQGHVNCPTTWPDCEKMGEYNMKLSLSRAKAVYAYMEAAGIDKQRMTYKGFGATQMIYPDARSEDKMEKNRRVEILVTGFE